MNIFFCNTIQILISACLIADLWVRKVKALFTSTSNYLLIPVLSLFLYSCGEDDKVPAGRITGEGTGYARGFDIEVMDGHTMLTAYNPWQGASNVQLRYILVDDKKNIENITPLPEAGDKIIRTPVKSVICLSTTHIAMLDLIGETGAITAVSGGDYIYNPDIRKRLENGELTDIGYDMNLNYERILELGPDIILAYGVGAEAKAWLNRLMELGITVVLIGEYLEDTPLAQAEWVKFVAHLFDKQDLATEKFREIEKDYLELSELSKSAKERPVVMSGLPWRNSWFVPGGNSNFATLISDAGGRYLWEDDPGRENFPVDIENVIDRGSIADYWINTGTALTPADIVNTDPRLSELRPFVLDNLFNNNARLSSRGGNDYWESGTVNPHIVLRDLIHIIHPELLDGHQPVYYRKL